MQDATAPDPIPWYRMDIWQATVGRGQDRSKLSRGFDDRLDVWMPQQRDGACAHSRAGINLGRGDKRHGKTLIFAKLMTGERSQLDGTNGCTINRAYPSRQRHD
ncbi:MAG: hypothetical protein AAFR70_01840 [Pseudomonadota bacterium]